MRAIAGGTTEKRAMAYVRARAKGMTQKQAVAFAGYSPKTSPSNVEEVRAVVEASKTLKEAILRRMTKDDLVGILARNAGQEEDKGASNQATKLLMDRAEPESAVSDTENKILMVFGADFEKPKQLEEPKD